VSKGAISSGTLTIGIFAIIVGLVGAYGIQTALLPKEEQAQAQVERIPIPVAACDLPINRVIHDGDLVNYPLTETERQDRMPADGMMMTQHQRIIGRQLKRPMRQGEAFSPSMFFPEGTGPNIADMLKPGFRAIDIEVQAADGGATVPVGANVDVLFKTFPREATVYSSAIPEMTTRMLEQAEVLTSRPSKARNGDGSAIVTLAVPADKVAEIQVVEGRGEFALIACPNSIDMVGFNANERLTFEEVLGIEPPVYQQQAEQAVHRTVIVRGSNFAVNEFAEPVQEQQSTMVASPMMPAGAKKECKTCKNKGGANQIPMPDNTPAPNQQLKPIPLTPIPVSAVGTEPMPLVPTRAVRPGGATDM